MLFNHPSIKSGFGSLTKDDMKVLKDVAQVERFKQSVDSMTQEERDLLSDKQKELYGDEMNRVLRWKEQFEQELYGDND